MNLCCFAVRHQFKNKTTTTTTTTTTKTTTTIFLRVLAAPGRAKRKIDELAHLLDVAKMNYRQLGGLLDEDQKKHEEERESARSVNAFVYRYT